ncbi:uncharacterized protein LOC133823176 [Humulus lupulus]|uniref:uncharacterized protein LOC133823176 n=1 Tax=Humulus lupulus TaxID=3486 RepID=UPI002B4046B4|nr:uncharacterized protein LOC133823176 [Humulus lupulus]
MLSPVRSSPILSGGALSPPSHARHSSPPPTVRRSHSLPSTLRSSPHCDGSLGGSIIPRRRYPPHRPHTLQAETLSRLDLSLNTYSNKDYFVLLWVLRPKQVHNLCRSALFWMCNSDTICLNTFAELVSSR